VSYFHVLVKFSGDNEAIECIFKDLSQEQLKRQFLKPYRKGNRLLSGARVIDVMSIAWTQIIHTERLSEIELKIIQERSLQEIQDFNRNSSVVLISAGRGYADEDIAEAGEDVTAMFIKHPPGAAPSVVVSILNHQWVVAVIGGIIVAGVVAWLGWG